MFDAVQEICPDLSAWYCVTHQGHAPLFHPTGVIWSQEGVQQGDPLGPALFAIGIQRVAMDLVRLHPELWTAFYLDDGVLVGEGPHLNDALREAEARFKLLNLSLNIRKCTLLSPADRPVEEHFNPLVGIPLTKWETGQVLFDGQTLLGVPIGSTSSVTAAIKKCAESLKVIGEEITKLEDPQCAMSLLRYCVGFPQVNHLLRSCPPTMHGDTPKLVDKEMERLVQKVLQVQLDEPQLKQVFLPASLGGMGIHSCMVQALPAYLSGSVKFLNDREMLGTGWAQPFGLMEAASHYEFNFEGYQQNPNLPALQRLDLPKDLASKARGHTAQPIGAQDTQAKVLGIPTLLDPTQQPDPGLKPQRGLPTQTVVHTQVQLLGDLCSLHFQALSFWSCGVQAPLQEALGLHTEG